MGRKICSNRNSHLDGNEPYNQLYSVFYGVQHPLLSICDTRLVAPVALDLRVNIMWDSDMTDVELEVTEPSGEKCTSFNNKTANHGMMSRNFSHGYGPVEYLMRYAQAGIYHVSVKLFSSMQKYTGTTIFVQIWAFYGNPTKEQLQCYTVRLEKDRESHHVASILFQ